MPHRTSVPLSSSFSQAGTMAPRPGNAGSSVTPDEETALNVPLLEHRSVSYDSIADADHETSSTQNNHDVVPPPIPTQNNGDDAPNDVKSIWSIYAEALDRNPLLVKSITAFFILGLGDLSGQGVEHLRGTSESGVDWPRMLRFGCFGLMGAPWSHCFYHWLDSVLPPTERPFSKTNIFKVFLDQFVQAPLLLALIIVALAVMKFERVSQIEQDLHDNYLDTLYANWKLWIPCSAMNMALVAPPYRVLFVNVVFFVWTIILSIMLNS